MRRPPEEDEDEQQRMEGVEHATMDEARSGGGCPGRPTRSRQASRRLLDYVQAVHAATIDQSPIGLEKVEGDSNLKREPGYEPTKSIDDMERGRRRSDEASTPWRLPSTSASQAIALKETDSLHELLVQLIDERVRAVNAGLTETAVSDQAKKEDGFGPLDPGPTTSTRAGSGEKSRRRREDPTLSRMVSPTGTPPRL